LKHLRQMVDQLGSDDLLMHATDYPHWHEDEPGAGLPIELSPERTRKIMAENARSWYRLN
jgi:predicted TIM-barrel fold metal-dependent hydrolase